MKHKRHSYFRLRSVLALAAALLAPLSPAQAQNPNHFNFEYHWRSIVTNLIPPGPVLGRDENDSPILFANELPFPPPTNVEGQVCFLISKKQVDFDDPNFGRIENFQTTWDIKLDLFRPCSVTYQITCYKYATATEFEALITIKVTNALPTITRTTFYVVPGQPTQINYANIATDADIADRPHLSFYQDVPVQSSYQPGPITGPAGYTSSFGATAITFTAPPEGGTWQVPVRVNDGLQNAFTTLTLTTSIPTSNLTLQTEGGSFLPNNRATAGTAFAKDSFINEGPHTIPHLNDGIYGNANSWIALTNGSFAGVSLGATPIPVNRIAFGRDNLGTFTDRALDYYTVQYTTAPNPDATTTSWTSIGEISYPSASIANPALRHLFSFPTVSATGLRIITATGGTCIDEIEIYSPPTAFELWQQQHFGSATTNIGLAEDFDSDGSANLLEFAFGTLPTNGTHRPLSFSGNNITVGSPIIAGSNVFFIRRKDYLTAGITYTAELSPNLSSWNPSIETPTVLADDGTHQVVCVPMTPGLLREFFRVRVTGQ